jgi:hypothetical protein
VPEALARLPAFLLTAHYFSHSDNSFSMARLRKRSMTVFVVVHMGLASLMAHGAAIPTNSAKMTQLAVTTLAGSTWVSRMNRAGSHSVPFVDDM